MKKLLWISSIVLMLMVSALSQVQWEEDGTMMETSSSSSGVESSNTYGSTNDDSSDDDSTSDDDSNDDDSVSDDDSSDHDKMMHAKKREIEIKNKKESLKIQNEELKKRMHAEMNEKREWMKKEIEENRMQMHADIKAFHEEKKAFNIGEQLNEEQHTQLAEIKKAWKTEIDALVLQLKSIDNAEDRKDLVDQISELNKSYAEKIKAIIGEVSEEAANMVDKRMEIMDSNNSMRKEHIDMRYEFRAEKKDMIKQYKATFKFKLKSKLDTIPADKLEKVLVKLNTVEENITNNTKLSDEVKEKMLSQVSALREILDEKIEEYKLKNDEMIDLDALFE